MRPVIGPVVYVHCAIYIVQRFLSRTDGRKDGWTDGQTVGRTDGRTREQIFFRICEDAGKKIVQCLLCQTAPIEVYKESNKQDKQKITEQTKITDSE